MGLVMANPVDGFRLAVPRDPAAIELAALLQRGRALKTLRIRSLDQLDTARGHKQLWVRQTTECLERVFHDNDAAEYFNEWQAPILPEYAPVEAFAELFLAEVNQRLGRLKQLLRQMQEQPKGHAPPSDENGAAAPRSISFALVPEPVSFVEAPVSFVDNSRPASPVSNAPAPAISARKTPAPAISARKTPAPQREEATMEASQCGKVLLVTGESENGAEGAVGAFLSALGVETVALRGRLGQEGAMQQLDSARDAAFAILQLPAEPSHDGQEQRQRWSFHLGYLAGRFGPGRVVLIGAAAGYPLACLALDAAGGWQLQLARQMKRAGLAVDLNRLC